MKAIFKIITITCVISLLTGCGGGGGSSDIDGPTLSVGEALSLVIDQFYVNSALVDEYGSKGEYSVYLRDAGTGEDVACAEYADGMEELSKAGVYYGGLTIPMTEIDGDHPNELASFQLLFVEQDGEGCPNPIDTSDDIMGITPEFTFDGLIDTKIWATNGQAVAVFRNKSDDPANVTPMVSSVDVGLIIDQIYFDNGSDGQTSSRYYIFVEQIEDNESAYVCRVDDTLMNEIRFGGIIYSALNFPIPCFSATDPDFDYTEVKLGLYIQKNDGPKLVGETKPMEIADLIGERAAFTNGKGYVTFRNVITKLFGSGAMRLDELTDVRATALSYDETPSYNPTMELHIMNSTGDYIIACAGENQGLTNVDAPGDHEDLSANFIAANGQRELFGWNNIIIKLVDRTDGYSCPAPLAGTPTVLARSSQLSANDLLSGTVGFLNGAGTLTLEAPASDNN